MEAVESRDGYARMKAARSRQCSVPSMYEDGKKRRGRDVRAATYPLIGSRAIPDTLMGVCVGYTIAVTQIDCFQEIVESQRAGV